MLNLIRAAIVAALASGCFTPVAAAQTSSGTAFAVAPELLVTNEHVIAGCRSVEIIAADGRRSGLVVDADAQIDLALLRVRGIKGAMARLRNPHGVRLGEPVMVFGFPLAGALSSGGNFTSGLVSALRGLRDAAGELQITAPVQPGNSGGPLMDASGLVIGVVQTKLDAIRAAVATGDIPQNVNFAIALEVLAEFLNRNKVPFRDGATTAPLDTARVAAMAQSFTYRVQCGGRSRQAEVSPSIKSKPPPQVATIAPPAPVVAPPAPAAALADSPQGLAPGGRSASAAEPVVKQEIEGRTVQFVVPEGYCALNRDNARERQWFEQLARSNQGRNTVAVVFAQCGELASFEKSEDYRVRHHGYYAVTLTRGKLVLLPADYNREKYLAEVKPYVEKTTAAAIDNAVKKSAGAGDKGKVSTVKMQVRGADGNAIFVGSDSVYESKGSRIRVEGVTALTLIKGIPVSLHLLQDQADNKQREKLFEQQKQAAARFIAANK